MASIAEKFWFRGGYISPLIQLSQGNISQPLLVALLVGSGLDLNRTIPGQIHDQASPGSASSQQVAPERIKGDMSETAYYEGKVVTEVDSNPENNLIPQDNKDDSIYQHLSGAKDTHIRILILEPGVDNDGLAGRLEVVNLTQAHRSFEAISYVWGSDIKDQSITIGGKEMAITTSLRDSLRQTRWPDKPRALWADAICINQEDDKEKGHQVWLMGRIYKASRCTLICLGYGRNLRVEARNAQDVAALIAEIEEAMDRVLSAPGFSMEWDSFPRPIADDPFLGQEKWRPWRALLRQPWFRRGWVVQETALGPECRVLWAGVEISWISILRANQWLTRRLDSLFLTRGDIPQVISYLHSRTYLLQRQDEARTLFSRRPISGLEGTTTLEALNEARLLKVKDPRDRIYAFMALPTSDGAMPDLRPNYGEDTSYLDVYRDFAVQYLEKTLDLDILSFAFSEEDVALAATSSVPALPSWIPRWDRIAPSASRRIWKRGRGKLYNDTQEMAILNNNSTLRVRAIIFDSVKFVSEGLCWKQAADSRAVASVVSCWRNVAEQSNKWPGPHKSHLGLAFLDMMCLGACFGDPRQWKDAEHAFANLLQADSPNLSMDIYEEDQDAQTISNTAVGLSYKTRLSVLGRGYYGSSSTATREGDVCAIIFGTRSPFILREVVEKEDWYTLVGPAYVHSAVTYSVGDVEGFPRGMGDDANCEDWKDWDLPSRDIFLC